LWSGMEWVFEGRDISLHGSVRAKRTRRAPFFLINSRRERCARSIEDLLRSLRNVDRFGELMPKSEMLAGLLLPLCLALCSCSQANSTRLDFQMGEKVALGPLTYTVIQTSWKNQLGDGFKVRTPQHRFLLINISVTNGGGKEVALPLFKLEN